MHLAPASRGRIRRRRAAYIYRQGVAPELCSLFGRPHANFSPSPPRRPRHSGGAMGQKGKSVLLRLVSEAGTGFFYTTRKNPVKTPHKLAFVKYDGTLPETVRVLFGGGAASWRCLGEGRRHARADRPGDNDWQSKARASHVGVAAAAQYGRDARCSRPCGSARTRPCTSIRGAGRPRRRASRGGADVGDGGGPLISPARRGVERGRSRAACSRRRPACRRERGDAGAAGEPPANRARGRSRLARASENRAAARRGRRRRGPGVRRTASTPGLHIRAGVWRAAAGPPTARASALVVEDARGHLTVGAAKTAAESADDSAGSSVGRLGRASRVTILETKEARSEIHTVLAGHLGGVT